MGGNTRSWSWEVPVFEPRDEEEEDGLNRMINLSVKSRNLSVNSVISRRLSIPSHVDDKVHLYSKLLRLRESLMSTRDEFLEIRQEASDLQEYSSAKLTRVMRYLGVLAERTRKLDCITTDYELRLAFLRKEKSAHFNELVALKGNIRVYVRARPTHTSETITEMAFPDQSTIIINQKSTLPIEFRFDQVYEPQVSQGEFFQDIQPLIQSALDGYNVSIFACGARGSGKTYTLEGPSHDRGVYFRAFEELFDLSNGESTPSSKFTFYVSMLIVSDDKVEDLLSEFTTTEFDSSLEHVVQHEVANPTEFARLYKTGLQNQNASSSCMIVTFHVHYTNTSTREKQYSKLSLVDVPGYEQQMSNEGVSSSFTSLVEVISALVSKKESVPYKNSKIARILTDSLGGDSKVIIILNISPSDSQETKPWLKAAKLCNDSSRSLQNMIYEEQNKELKMEVEKLKKSLKASEDQCTLLFRQLQRHLPKNKVSDDSNKLEKDQIIQLKTQVAQYAKYDRDQKAELANRASKILSLEDKVQELNLQSAEARGNDKDTHTQAGVKQEGDGEELQKRDELIERLHEENEKLFQHLTENNTFSPKVRPPEPRAVDNFELGGSAKNLSVKRTASPQKRNSNNNRNVERAIQKTNSRTTPAGEYLISALSDFDPDHYQGPAAVSDAANKLLMLVLAAVIKAGAAREHDMLEEIRGAVFAFIRKLEPRKLVDSMLVARVRILYVRSLLAKSPELESFKVSSVGKFFEKVGQSKSSRTSSSGSSPTRSPVSTQSSIKKDLTTDEHINPFKLNLKPEKASKFSSIVLKLRGIDQETWRQHVTGAKLREVNEEARNYAVGNKKLAALFVHTPAGELQRRIRGWLAENFEFLSLTSRDMGSNSTGQLELLSTAIMDGWMAGLGIPTRPSTDALGQLLSEYTKHVYISQLQHLKDVAATLATEEAEDLVQVAKVRSALESIDNKRRKILQQMRNDPALLTKEEGGSPLRCPSTASEEARIASLISLEDICNQAEEIRKEAPQKATFASKKKFMLSRLDALAEQTSALLSMDHPCAHKFIKAARRAVEGGSPENERAEYSSSSGEYERNLNPLQAAGEVVQWSVLQFNNGNDPPFIIKCGATPLMQLVIKSATGENNKETVAIVPSPATLSGLSLEEIRSVLQPLPEAFRQLAMAKTADGTRARYSRLYKTLAVRVPALRSSISDTETTANESDAVNRKRPLRSTMVHARRASDSDNFLSDY